MVDARVCRRAAQPLARHHGGSAYSLFKFRLDRSVEHAHGRRCRLRPQDRIRLARLRLARVIPFSRASRFRCHEVTSGGAQIFLESQGS